MLETEAHLDSDAVERLIKATQSPRILHLATHGFFLEDVDEVAHPPGSPGMPTMSMPGSEAFRGAGEGPVIRSGLAMAGANSCLRGDPVPLEAEDGLLSADDAADLSLDATDLVVLSACDTGLGDIRIGQGVLGLRSAFILAGARSLVMSLWRVPDQETKRLMINFYRGLLRGLPVAEALREAQLAVKADRPGPVYWAGFICQGDPGDLTSADCVLKTP